jgi:hypothetical protein
MKSLVVRHFTLHRPVSGLCIEIESADEADVDNTTVVVVVVVR